MSRKSYLEQACADVPEFQNISNQFLRKHTIAGESDSFINNYLLQISKMVLHFGCTALELSVDQMKEYLFHLRQNDTPSMCLELFKLCALTNKEASSKSSCYYKK